MCLRWCCDSTCADLRRQLDFVVELRYAMQYLLTYLLSPGCLLNSIHCELVLCRWRAVTVPRYDVPVMFVKLCLKCYHICLIFRVAFYADVTVVWYAVFNTCVLLRSCIDRLFILSASAITRLINYLGGYMSAVGSSLLCLLLVLCTLRNVLWQLLMLFLPVESYEIFQLNCSPWPSFCCFFWKSKAPSLSNMYFLVHFGLKQQTDIVCQYAAELYLKATQLH